MLRGLKTEGLWTNIAGSWHTGAEIGVATLLVGKMVSIINYYSINQTIIQ